MPDLDALLVGAGVPRRFGDRRLSTFSARPGTAKALAAARLSGTYPPQRGLVLIGPPGTGKTHLAVGALAASIEAYLARYPQPVIEQPDGSVVVRPTYPVAFRDVPWLLDELRHGYGNDAAGMDPLVHLIGVSLLILDDLGRERVTDWVTERLYVLVNARYNVVLPTIVTTNYGPEALEERGYGALVSRLSEGAEYVELTASDYRTAR